MALNVKSVDTSLENFQTQWSDRNKRNRHMLYWYDIDIDVIHLLRVLISAFLALCIVLRSVSAVLMKPLDFCDLVIFSQSATFSTSWRLFFCCYKITCVIQCTWLAPPQLAFQLFAGQTNSVLYFCTKNKVILSLHFLTRSLFIPGRKFRPEKSWNTDKLFGNWKGYLVWLGKKITTVSKVMNTTSLQTTFITEKREVNQPKVQLGDFSFPGHLYNFSRRWTTADLTAVALVLLFK